MNSLIILALQAPCVIFATTLHEFTRAFVSTKLGDNRPRDNGRLTLNPFKHFEPIGFLLALLTGFGWGLPVETSSLYYKEDVYKRQEGYLTGKNLLLIMNSWELEGLFISFLYRFAKCLSKKCFTGLLLTILMKKRLQR